MRSSPLSPFLYSFQNQAFNIPRVAQTGVLQSSEFLGAVIAMQSSIISLGCSPTQSRDTYIKPRCSPITCQCSQRRKSRSDLWGSTTSKVPGFYCLWPWMATRWYYWYFRSPDREGPSSDVCVVRQMMCYVISQCQQTLTRELGWGIWSTSCSHISIAVLCSIHYDTSCFD